VKITGDIGRKPAGMSSANNVKYIILYIINHYHRMTSGFLYEDVPIRVNRPFRI
jgi:hypothetical protein